MQLLINSWSYFDCLVLVELLAFLFLFLCRYAHAVHGGLHGWILHGLHGLSFRYGTLGAFWTLFYLFFRVCISFGKQQLLDRLPPCRAVFYTHAFNFVFTFTFLFCSAGANSSDEPASWCQDLQELFGLLHQGEFWCRCTSFSFPTFPFYPGIPVASSIRLLVAMFFILCDNLSLYVYSSSCRL